ncbi:M56 family metallopeptidase [Mesonia sp.]|uniref:M56 family metallopeptidase n=1 Tax=Mesonia sp. TaxID=1960830 RepID=UPI003F9D55FB
METLFYILKSTAILSLFLLVYKLVLQKDTFFKSNRYFLLLGLVCAFTFPALEFTQTTIIEAAPVSESGVFSGEALNYSGESLVSREENEFNWQGLWLQLYWIGVAFMGIRLLLQTLSLLKILKHPKQRDEEGFYHIQLPQKTAPFSFFKLIAYHVKSYQAKELELIILHEKVHGRQNHSIDVILHQLMLLFFWFNPMAWWYNKQMLENLEFIADHEVAKRNNIHQKEYELTLLKAATSYSSPILGNSFYQSLIKKRILMLHQKPSSKYAWAKSLLILPLLSFFLWSFNVKEEVRIIPLAENEPTLIHDTEILKKSKFITSEVNSTNKNLEQHTPEALLIQQEKSYEITKFTTNRELKSIRKKLENDLKGTKVKFSNLKRNKDKEITSLTINTKFEGNSRFIKNITLNDKKAFPIQLEPVNNTLKIWTRKNEATIIAKNGVSSKNEITSSDKLGKNPLTIINGKEVDKSKESTYTFGEDSSLKVNKIEPKKAQKLYGKKAKDGAIIMREVPDENNSTSNQWIKSFENGYSTSDKVSSNPTPSLQKDPLYYINGKKATKAEALQLKPDDIESVNVLKREAAIEKYGKKAENGALEMKLRNSPNQLNSRKEILKEKQERDKVYREKKSSKKTPLEKRKQQPTFTYAIDGIIVDKEKVTSLLPEQIKEIAFYTKKDAKNKLNIKTEGEKLMHVRLYKEGKEKSTSAEEVLQQKKYQTFLSKNNPLIVVNNKEVSRSFIENLNKKLIQSVFIVEGEKAIEKYGEKAKHGVLVITTRP